MCISELGFLNTGVSLTITGACVLMINSVWVPHKRALSSRRVLKFAISINENGLSSYFNKNILSQRKVCVKGMCSLKF